MLDAFQLWLNMRMSTVYTWSRHLVVSAEASTGHAVVEETFITLFMRIIN